MKNYTIISALVALWISTSVFAAPPPKNYDVERILDAIEQVESSGNPNAVGDGGKAIGAFQIHRAYWKDAVEFDPSIGGVYEDCFDPQYSRRIVVAYLTRYCKEWTDENVARIHNGGPSGHKRKATVKYWIKVKSVLQRSK